MSYNAALMRVRCEFTREDCLASETPPEDLTARARAKLEAVKAAGEIGFFYVYETRLNEVWEALRAAEDETDDRRVQLTLGAGAPLLAGIRIDKPASEKQIAQLSVDADAGDIADWRWEWFKLSVQKRLREAGIKELPSNGQIYSIFARLKAGEGVQSVPLTPVPPAAPAANAKAFSVVANKQRMEIGVVIRNVKELRKKSHRDQMLALISQAVKQLSVDGVEYRILKKDFLAALQSALDGPEGLGVDLPLSLLAAVGKPRIAVPANYPGAGRISFQVSADKMEATIAGFQMEYYEDAAAPVTVEWVQNELKRCLIAMPMADDIAKGVAEAVRTKSDLNGVLAVRGIAGVGGQNPKLYPVYKDAAARGGGDLDQDDLDMREMQQRETVKAGQLIAEIRFGTTPASGKNVYGDEVPPPPSDDLMVRVGEGVLEQAGGRYYASADGIPVVDEAAISLMRILVHEGDVNLRTGNIRFDGPVEIKGSIDSGAIVETSGDLTVHGEIRAGFVRSRGNVTVHGGVTTGEKGGLQARGDIVADFVENSTIVCGGNLSVTKALLNSRVFSGGLVKLTGKGGVAAGGQVTCRDGLVTESLGFARGATTVLDVGADWRVARSGDIRRRRLAKLQARAQEDRGALREIVQKKPGQLTPRHVKLKEELQERLTRLRSLCERLEAQIARLAAQVSYNQNATVQVKETLNANVQLTVAGQVVPVTADVAGVAVLARRRRGSHFIPLEEIEQEEQEARAAAAAAMAAAKQAS